jgi:phosphogluconate 2-dehydrogenase
MTGIQGDASMTSGQPQRILILDAELAQAAAEIAPLFPSLALVCASGDAPAAELARQGGFAGLIAQAAEVDAALLSLLDGVQVVLKMGRSTHNIDMDAARARGLTIACAPRKGPNCVAELALTFIMALSKDLIASHDSVADGAYRYRGLRPERSSQWKMAFHWMKNQAVHEVGDKTLGIIGMGEIGCELARRAAALDMRTVYYKRTPLPPELEARFSASYRDLDALLAESDYVVIAAPHTPETERMIGERELALMKPTAYIVNIARGGVIDEDALIACLEERRIAGAGLDVFTFEPLPEDSPLCDLDNVMLTPHIGGGTGTNRVIELTAAAAEMARILTGEKPRVDVSRAAL